MSGRCLAIVTCLLLVLQAAAGEPAPTSRAGGWLGASIEQWPVYSYGWYGPQGELSAGQMWGRRAALDGARFLETFNLVKDIRRPEYKANVQLQAVAPLGRVGSLRLGLAPSIWVPPEPRYADITSSVGLTLNADDWDYMVAPAGLTYRGLGLNLDAYYTVGDLFDPLSDLGHRSGLSLQPQWTVRFGRTRIEAGPTASYYGYQAANMSGSEWEYLGARVLVAGGSRTVDLFVAPEFYAADGPGYEATLSVLHSYHQSSDTLYPLSDYTGVTAQGRVEMRVFERTFVETEMEARAYSFESRPDWGHIRGQPRVAVARLWPLGPGLVLPVQLSATLPVGLDLEGRYHSVYNEEVVLDVRVGLCGASPH